MENITLDYTCVNGHKWKSKEWPTSEWAEITLKPRLEVIPGKYLFGFIPIKPPKLIEHKYKATRCPICKTTITKCQSEDGKQGAIHIGFVDGNNN